MVLQLHPGGGLGLIVDLLRPGVSGVHGDVGAGIVLQLVYALHNGGVEAGDLGDLLRFGEGDVGTAGAVVGRGGAAREGDGFYLTERRHPRLIAGGVQVQEGAHRHQRHREHAGPLPPPAEDPEGLAQDHLGGEVADEAAGHQEEEQRPDAAGQGAQEEGVEQRAQGQGGAGGHTVLEHRSRPGDRHDVPRALQLPAAVEHQGQDGEGHPHQSVNQDIEEALEGPRPLGDGAGGGGIDLAAELEHGGEPAGQVADESGGRDKAEHHLPGQLYHQESDPRHQAVEDAVEHGQGGQMAGKHGTQRSEGVEEELHEAEAQKPQHRGPEGHRPGGGFHRQGEQKDQDIGHQQKGEAGEPTGPKEAAPGHRQGVEQTHRPGIIEIGEHRHGAHQTAHQRGHYPRAAQRGEYIPSHALYGMNGGGKAAVKQQAQRQGEEPENQVDGPQGPEALDVLKKERGIKPAPPHRGGGLRGRFPGRHSPHLPVHR